MPVPTDAMIRPVDGHEDLFAFRFDFVPQGKALDDAVVTEEDNGDLIIEGYAAVFDGEDREGENFAEGAFDAGIKAFVNGQGSLCYHHKHDKLMGRVLDLHREEGKGLKLRARVDGAIRKHPELSTYYDQVKNGSLSALSVGGFFKRAVVNGLQKIVGVDFTEISITPVPVHPGVKFAVVAGKALDDLDTAVSTDDDVNEQYFAGLLERMQSLTSSLGKYTEKALPEGHNPAAASHVHDLLNHLSRARSSATYAKESDHKGVANAADSLETDLAEHEKKLHKLAAKVGPLPPTY